MELQHLGPVFVKRGPREQQVAFRITDIGIDTAFPGAEDALAWWKFFPWAYVVEVAFDAGPNGSVLFVDSYRFRFPEHSLIEIRRLVEPHLAKLSTGWLFLNEPPSVLKADVTIEDRMDLAGGAEIWHSDWLAHDHKDLVVASAVWISEQPGVEGVLHYDIAVIIVDPAVDQSLRAALRTWWVERVDGVEMGW